MRKKIFQKLDFKDSRFFVLFLLVFTLSIFLYSKDFPFFWDNVTFGGKMGLFLYENGLFNFNFPEKFDPGHPPFLAFILAISWSLLGKSLWVSHLALIPFQIGLLWQLYRLIKNYCQNQIQVYLIFFFILLIPSLITQFFIVNPEIIQLFFALLALNGILRSNKTHQFVGLFFLGIVSYRGMMLFAGFFAFDFVNHLYIEKRKFITFFKERILIYLFAVIPALLFLIYHYQTKGWILQSHDNSPWKSLWQVGNLKSTIKNFVVLLWRFLDFGKIFIFLFIFFALIRKMIQTKSLILQKPITQLALGSLIIISPILITTIIFTASIGHRYFILSYILIALICMILLLQQFKFNKIIFITLCALLCSGNFWIYPPKIAQGWDATLAHLPYYKLHDELLQFIKEKNISIKDIASFFPNSAEYKYFSLNGSNQKFQQFNGENQYLLYSNIHNISDLQYNKIQKNYKVIKAIKTRGVFMNFMEKID